MRRCKKLTGMDKEALMMGKLVSGLVLTSEQDKQWVKARFEGISDILEESWVYQDILQKGKQQGKEQDILLFVELHFPSLLPQAKQVIGQRMPLEQFQTLLRKLYLAKTIEEATAALQSA